MRSLLAPRGLLLFWIIATAAAGLAPQLRQTGGELRRVTTGVVQPINSVFDSVNGFAATTATNFFRSVRFDPNGVVATMAAGATIRTRDIMALVGAVLLVVAVMVYQGAMKSDSFADDLVALFFLYFFVVVELAIVLGLGFSVQAAFQRGFVLSFFVLLIILLSVRNGALDDSRLFFRGLIEIVILTLFIFPGETVGNLAGFLEGLAAMGENLRGNANIFLFWSILGMILALGELYAIGTRKSPALAAAKKPKGNGGGG